MLKDEIDLCTYIPALKTSKKQIIIFQYIIWKLFFSKFQHY